MRTLTRHAALVFISASLALAGTSIARAQETSTRTNGPAEAHQAGPRAAPSIDHIVDCFIVRETELLRALLTHHPLVETYIQTLAPDRDLGTVPKEDHYFLGELDLSEGVNSRSLVAPTGLG